MESGRRGDERMGAAGSRPDRLLFLVPVLALWIFFSFGRHDLHHWDEFSYLYGVANFPVSSLLGDEFAPSNVPGFFNAKIGHLLLLAGLVKVVGIGLSSLTTGMYFYSFLMIASAAMLGAVVFLLFGNKVRAVWVSSLYLVIPVNVYLSGKFLAEVPGLFWGMASLLALTWALRRGSSLELSSFAALSGLFLAFCLLSRQDSVLLIVGAWFAMLGVTPSWLSRTKLVKALLLAGASGGIALLTLDRVFGLHLFAGLSTAQTVFNQKLARSLKVTRILYAQGPLMILAPFALLNRDRRASLFFVLWWLAVLLPIVLVFRYLEERYLATVAPGLAGAAVAGCEVWWGGFLSRLPRGGAVKALGVALLVLVVAASNRFIQPRTQFGFNLSAYTRVLDYIDKEHPGRPILIPWGFTDFHFIRFAYPQVQVYLVNTTAHFWDRSVTRDERSWGAAQKRWYGPRYLPDISALKDLGDAPWIVVAWVLPGWDTMKCSWIDREPFLHKEKVLEDGPYKVYLVREARSLPPTTAYPGG